MALVPVTAEVSVPFDLHRFIIGQKGKDVREMMTTFDVNIKGMLYTISKEIHYSVPQLSFTSPIR